MGKRRLEFTHTEAQLLGDCIVDPCLLEDVATRGSCIHADVIVDLAKSLTRKADDSVGHGEARIGDVVLIVGFVEALVVVILEVGRCLQKEVGLEHETAIV